MKFLPDFIIRTPLFSTVNQVNDQYFTEAIYLASPSLYFEKQKSISNLLKEKKEIRKFNTSIYKYQSRACNRCTPFGLFAGLNIGHFTDESNVKFDSDLYKTLKRETRLDMNVLCEIVQEISKKECVKPFLLFYPNTTLYTIGDYYRYVEHYYLNNSRKYKISKVDFSEYLKLIFLEAKEGKTIIELVNLLVLDTITYDEAKNFINELISEQLLVSELEPTITGKEYFIKLMEVINRILKINKFEEIFFIEKVLKDIDQSIKKLDQDIFNSIDNYKNIYEKVKQLAPNIIEANLLQTNLYKNPQISTINIEVQEVIKEGLNFLNKITPKVPNQILTNFKKRFSERYEDQEIALLQVLDTETGIGYPYQDTEGINDLVDDLADVQSSSHREIKWTKLESTLYKILNKSILNNEYQITLSEDDFKNIDYSEKNLPHSLAIRFNVIDTNKNILVLKSTGGSSAINIIGRFANSDEQILKIVSEIAEFEQVKAGENILAEIVHLPENRTGNILTRPVIREYEIPYLATSSVSFEYQIDVSDLFLSIKNNRLILKSKRMNKQIIPRLGNAHNFEYKTLPVYHFLCDLQTQYYEKSYIGFNWGVLVNEFEFLPRVNFKNIIISPATWQLKKHHFERLLNLKNEEESLLVFLDFKNKYGLPNLFLISDGDNELLIDTSQKIAIITFIDVLKNRSTIKLIEFLFDSESPLVKDSEGNIFTNECIGFVLNEGIPLQNQEFITSEEIKSKKQFILGSEWLYYKIYSGVKTADDILVQKLKPITEYLINIGYIDKWFFIRYNDPDNHIRFRLHIKNKSQYNTIILLIHSELNSLMEDGSIFKILTDTYVREINRYGDNSIELAEDLFYYDSISCVNILTLLTSENKDSIRWKIALKAIDEILNNFGLSIEEKLHLMEFLSDQFFKEHGGNRELKGFLGNKFRQHRNEIELLLNKDFDNNRIMEINQLIKVIDVQSNNQELIIKQIKNLHENNKLQVNFNDFLASIVHMKLNRLFISQQRKNELVIYDLLTRYYKSFIAKLNKK